MAKFQVGKGMDQYLTQLQNLEYQSDDLIGHLEEFFLTHILAVEVEIIGETVDSLNEP